MCYFIIKKKVKESTEKKLIDNSKNFFFIPTYYKTLRSFSFMRIISGYTVLYPSDQGKVISCIFYNDYKKKKNIYGINYQQYLD